MLHQILLLLLLYLQDINIELYTSLKQLTKTCVSNNNAKEMVFSHFYSTGKYLSSQIIGYESIYNSYS